MVADAKLRLSRGDLALELAPGDGGGVGRLSYRGIETLAPPAAGAMGVACFPMVPYANRIARGCFSWEGRPVRLSPNLAGHPHPLHGHGWRSSWNVDEAASDRAVLTLDYAGGEWPWAYRAAQTIALTDDGVRMSLALTNLAQEAAPVGLGFHPYFPGRDQARLKARLAGAWPIDDERLPTGHEPGPLLADFSVGATVAKADLIDHCHTGWDGQATIVLLDRGLSITLSASPELAWLHIYSPPGQDFFCAEPVSHRPDALNATDPRGQGVLTLGPGETATVWMVLEIAAT